MAEITEDYKIHVESPEQSKQVQEVAFKQGFGWRGFEKTTAEEHRPYLFVSLKDNSITYSNERQPGFFESDERTKISPKNFIERFGTTVETTKFKVGDRVKSTYNYENQPVGTIVSTHDEGKPDLYGVKYDEGLLTKFGRCYTFVGLVKVNSSSEDNLELIEETTKFKVGDNVEVVDNGKTYSTWFQHEESCPLFYVDGFSPADGSRGVITNMVVSKQGCVQEDHVIIRIGQKGCQKGCYNDVVIGAEGLQKIVKAEKEIEFKVGDRFRHISKETVVEIFEIKGDDLTTKTISGTHLGAFWSRDYFREHLTKIELPKVSEEEMSVQPSIRLLDWFGKFEEEEPKLEDLSDPDLFKQGLQDYDKLLDNFNSVAK